MGGNCTTPSIFSFCQEASSSKSTAKATSESNCPKCALIHRQPLSTPPASLTPRSALPALAAARAPHRLPSAPETCAPPTPRDRDGPCTPKAKLEPKKPASLLGLTLLTNWAWRVGEGREALGRIPGTVTRPSVPPGGAAQRVGLKGTGTKTAGPGPNCKASF